MNSEFRIKKNSEFADVIGKKQILKSENFNIYYKQNTLSHLRFGLSVSKKIGNAVIRNKVKRQLRSIILFNKNIHNKNFDIIIIAKPEFLKKSYQENFDEFVRKIETIL